LNSTGADAAIGLRALLALGRRAMVQGRDWLLALWAPGPREEIPASAGEPAAVSPLYAERKVVYANFRHNVHTLLDAMDGGVYPLALLYEVRDQWVELRRIAPPGVIEPATALINALKPLIDRGPTDEAFSRFTRALHDFENACRADRGLVAPTPVAGQRGAHARPEAQAGRPKARRRYFSVDPPVSEVLDQSDEEAALTREFVGCNVQVSSLPPRELAPRR
jgi:hypothetical protein